MENEERNKRLLIALSITAIALIIAALIIMFVLKETNLAIALILIALAISNYDKRLSPKIRLGSVAGGFLGAIGFLGTSIMHTFFIKPPYPPSDPSLNLISDIFWGCAIVGSTCFGIASILSLFQILRLYKNDQHISE